MKMKQSIIHWLGCALFALSGTLSTHAANGIIETRKYQICPGDQITVSANQVVVTVDTILYDTLHVTDPDADSVYVYVVNVYPSFRKEESREIETGTGFEWRGLNITKAGTYERVYKTVHECDSTYILTVTERTAKPEKQVQFTLCEGETVVFNGKTYTNAGTFYEPYTADSVYKITIVKYPAKIYQSSAVFDGRHPYIWHIPLPAGFKDSTITEAGVYEHVERNSDTGCGDIYRLFLRLDSTAYHFTETATICESEEFSWRGQTQLNRQHIGETAHYYERHRTADNQADSIYELILTVYPVSRVARTVPFCERIEWNDVTYTESTVIVDTLHSLVHYCDSIVTTYLTKGNRFFLHDTATIALGESLVWHGRTITTAGLYEDRHQTSFGCDSIYTLGVGMKDSAPQAKIRTYYETICDNDELLWREKTYWKAGMYIDTTYVPGTTTVDSLYVLVLTVHPSYEITELVTFASFPVSYRGISITGAGTYPLHLYTALGCDSIINITVTQQPVRNEQWATICPGETFIWRGKQLKEAHQYIETLRDIHGNDSVEYVLNLSVRYIPDTYITRSICQGSSYSFGGRLLTQSGVYRHTFHETGCDSTVVLSLNVLKPDTVYAIHHISEGETYTWHGKEYSKTGIAYYTTTNRFGCDSTEILQLTIHHVDTIDTTAVICPGETMVWNGITASQSGTFSGTYQQPDGSVNYYRLNLTVLPLKELEKNFTLCAEDAVNWNGKTYTEAGYYYDYLGCDTLVRIHVMKHPQQIFETNATLGGSNAFTWSYWSNGREYKNQSFSSPGTYEYTSPNAETGCTDVWRLILREDKTSYLFEDTLTICQGDDFSWRGLGNLGQVVGTSVYEDKLKTRSGQDSIYRLTLIVLPIERTVRTVTFCGSITWRGKTYTESTIVYDTVALPTGCYREERINLDKAQSYHTHDTATIVQGEILRWNGYEISTNGLYTYRTNTVDGCDSVAELGVGLVAATPQTNLYSERITTCYGDTVLWRGKHIWLSGTHIDTVWANGHEKVDSIFALNLTFWPSYKDTIIEHLYTCAEGSPIRYHNKDYYENDTVVSVFHTIHGCDSIVKAYLHFNEALQITEHVGISDKELPYTWRYKLHDQTKRDTIITESGTYYHTTVAEGGCENKEVLQLEVYPTYLYEEHITVCAMDLPYHWTSGPADHQSDDLSESKIYEFPYRTVNDADSIYRLHLTILPDVDTIVNVRGCQNKGAYWNNELYWKDTTFIVRVPVLNPVLPDGPCDTVYHINITLDTVYSVRWDTTLCEHQLPLIVGRVNPDTIWTEGPFIHPDDTTLCGCDSIIEGYLKIIPKLTRNDSTFVCQSFLDDGGSVVLGDTVTPAFATKEAGKWAELWRGKWQGVAYNQDTIIWDCDSNYFHHIIVRPSQTVPKDTTYYLCAGDSVQLFWPKATWVKRDTVYLDTVPMSPRWTDTEHGYSYNDQRYVCDSVTRWTIKFVQPEKKDTTAHRLLGDSLWWGGAWRYYTGAYDSIGAAQGKNSDSVPCRLTYTLHLIIDTAYYFRDTIDLCTPKHKSHSYIWPETGYEQTFTVGTKDTIAHHFVDSLLTYDRRDSIYDLCVNYRIIRDTLVFDTICEDTKYRFNTKRGTVERWINQPGRYTDTLTAINGCDSIVTLQLYVRDRIPTAHTTVHLPDTLVPYSWKHTWLENGHPTDSTQWLSATGEYAFHMPSVLGCDSVDSISFFVHNTYRIQEDNLVYCADQTPITWQNRNDITGSGDYTFHALTRDGYDSIRYVHIEILPVLRTLLVDTLCEGDSLRFGLTRLNRPRFLTKAGVYYDTLTSVEHGCDSIIELRLNVYPKYRRHQLIEISDKELPYAWEHIQGGRLIETELLNGTGEYAYRFTSAYGCDSVDSLSLRVYQTYAIKDDTIRICSDETPYTWHNYTNITESGEYTYHGQTVNGYDSLHTVYIAIQPVQYTSINTAICEGDTYKFGHTILTSKGTYRDTLVSASGCDSIVTLSLQVYPAGFQSENRRIFEGDSILFDGVWRKETGVYEKRTVNANNCTDTYQLVLTVLKQFNVDTTAVICDNDLPFVWRGYEFSATGDYTIPIAWTDSSRVVKTLHLTVNKAFYGERNITLCAGDKFNFKDHVYTQNGEFYDTIPSSVGCDSVVRYILSFHPTIDHVIEQHISDKEPFIFHNRVLTSSGTYEWTGKSINGCDSMEHLILTVHPSYFFSDTIDLCQSDTVDFPYNWRNYEITTSGIYTDSILTTYGFDSVYQLVVHVHPMYYSKEQYEIGVGEVLKLHGQDISIPGVYYDTLRTIHGCDSIFHIVVNQKRTREFTWNKEICEGEYFDFFGQKKTHTGRYTYTSQYKDSVVYLNLTVKPISVAEERLVITKYQLPYFYNGHMYESAGIYTDTMSNYHGCDSIHRIVLVVTEHYSEWYPIPLCPGSEIKIDNKVITESGLYSFIRRSRVTGEMDSIYRVEVYDAPAYDLPVESRTICDGDTCFFGGKAITRAGHYDFTFKTIDGCDSILHLDLTVNPSYYFITEATIADYETYTWLSKTYTKAGNYERTWPTVENCDSTYALRLDVVPTMRDTLYKSICHGDEFYWRGNTYDKDGYYVDTVRVLEADFSAIYALRLQVVYPTLITTARTGDICADAESFEIQFDYTGHKPTHYSVYFSALAQREGFRDIINEPFGADMRVHVPLPRYTDILYQGHAYYVRPDYYTLHLALDNGVCGISRSDSLQLVVKYPNWIIEQNWNDVVAPLKPELNGGYEFSQMEWFVNDVLQTNTGSGYLHNDALQPGDIVYMRATRKGENYAVPTCPLTIEDEKPKVYDTPVLVYPAAAPRRTPAFTVEAPQQGTYEIYTTTGNKIQSGRIEEGKNNVILPAVCGMYIFRVHQGNETGTHKVLIY